MTDIQFNDIFSAINSIGVCVLFALGFIGGQQP